MYVKSIVLEGFKSYGKRIEINGFDKEFNAITGFNGSGKSNILDAICFVLGITNLGQVRANSLQDLVYKSGQAGIKKATVTITFDNHDRESSPMGYEQHEEIVITRQVVIGGKNKYMINGTNVPNKRVQDLFCSVQLNVNNPHFLIMQGRITKVLNMKPVEILSMLEEAAGTKMYEKKKQSSLITIEKKDSKLKEINNILKEEIGPKLNKLKEERTRYVEFQGIERELEHSKRIHIAWKYVTALSNSQKTEEDVKTVQNKIDSKFEDIAAGQEEIKNIEAKYDKLLKKKEAEKSNMLEALEQELQEYEKKQFKLSAEVNSNKENVKAVKKTIEQIKINITDDKNALILKNKELEKVGGLFQSLKEKCQKDTEAVLEAQEKYQKISAGLLESEDGKNATLEQQLISAKQSITQAQTELKQCEMTLNHNRQQLNKKQKDMHNTGNEYKKYNVDLENKEKELKNLENEMQKLNYKDGYLEDLKKQRNNLIAEMKPLREQLDQFESRYPRTRFQYQNPEPNFNAKSVKGIVCKLINLKDRKAAYALEVAAGGKLYNVIVDTETTSKKILQHGQLQQRVTIIPLNRVTGRFIDQQTITLAQNLVGKENVQPALSLIDFPDEIRPAMTWIFGQIFVCKDMETAKKIAFHEKIMKKCVTLEGDLFDPVGTLSGGAPAKSGSVLLKLEELKEIRNELNHKEQLLKDVETTLLNVTKTAEKHALLKQKYDLLTYEINMIQQQLQQTSYHKIKEEVNSLNAAIEELTQRMTTAKNLEKESTKRAKDLEIQLKDAVNIREKQLKETENQLNILKKKAEKSRKEWQKREQESETLELEIKELKKSIENGNEQLFQTNEESNRFEEKGGTLRQELEETKSKVTELQNNVKKQKDIINQQNKDMQRLIARKEDIIKQNKDFELDIKKLNHEMNDIKKSAAECKHKVVELTKKYEWIEQEKPYFGKKGGIYDFEVNKPGEIEQKVHYLEKTREQLSRNINTRAINLLDKEEEQYNDTLKKKRIVENDKNKILETIKHLDEKKKQTLLKAWKQVNKDFGSIFSTLLPGAEAKLQPPENETITDGLEVKVGFSGAWKESLGELSGGQRSLVALSLVLAMLLYKPAPLYILDEVDAALDLSHTENIGTMLKRHFKHSQFIIVSLKNGMFNNANVLFTTRFIDGMSTISRSEKVKSK
ncbi:structural maintenance of chromosomes protein 2 [Monomorium pharaonis]|uniref:structural maintenance of chromosomes protein 2 n=1 Tax=Monomorium pharaonis TaxID=307658 RepID=UPI00063F77D7|nr:structural maintenance of chromosomes protein 2 [Monomorium pharaonis]XP_012525205.1 structural maintenance of chromosomes protein 2 [Monomorium pharaonis]XP_012525213.1 structural maintenance of chromosomes protein 2 [Monomorium pharaonis]XP_012525221.1 structural maintenance of chromosomes protein 2 [Monomorium pharaonis]